MFGVAWWDGRGKRVKEEEEGRPRKGGNHRSGLVGNDKSSSTAVGPKERLCICEGVEEG